MKAIISLLWEVVAGRYLLQFCLSLISIRLIFVRFYTFDIRISNDQSEESGTSVVCKLLFEDI